MNESGRGSLKFYSSRSRRERYATGNPFQSFCMQLGVSTDSAANRREPGKIEKKSECRLDGWLKRGTVKSLHEKQAKINCEVMYII